MTTNPPLRNGWMRFWITPGDPTALGFMRIVGGLLAPVRGEVGWRVMFLVGLLGAGVVMTFAMPESFAASPRTLPLVALAGLLVGVGTRLGNGCTSGHGVCGISRFSPRSIAATLTFMATGAGVVFAMRMLGGSA